jgi:glycosyltransferase involved in cell wall biosynthesis
MISVALCTYNGEKYIRQQLDSILSQSMFVDEIVICDDCSKDSTCTILESYAYRFPQIRLIKNEKNVGFRKNFENALIECKGDFIFFSDQDDLWHGDKVKKTVDYLNGSGNYGVFSDGILIDQDNNEMGLTLFSYNMLSPYISKGLLDNYTFEILCLKDNFVTGAALAITKEAKDMVIPFKTSQCILHDMWIALRLSSCHKLGYIDETLISYRIHPNQECGFDLKRKRSVDPLLNCFIGSGSCSYLLRRRRNCLGVMFNCRFDLKERRILFDTYKKLYFRCLCDDIWTKVKDLFNFYMMELYIKVRLVTLFLFKKK